MSELEILNRREAIERVVMMLGGAALVGGTDLLEAAARPRPHLAAGAGIGEFASDDVAFLDEIADTILPETTTPGARAAQTGAFIALMVTDSYDPVERSIFRDGMRALDERCRELHGVDFMSAAPQQRLTLLAQLDAEQKVYMDTRDALRRVRDLAAAGGGVMLPADALVKAAGPEAAAITADSPTHYFRMMKELALLGYFTSEIGCTQAQRYAETPGRFDPCVPYQPGEKSWAAHA
ncbi:MAG: gluconate 2-dehydrogenase subunit 3 family protein [Gemmatimonadota bacterium]